MIGERYARTINASSIVPVCGTIAKEVIRKHFEVPGCKACLITERSASLEAAGFVDMQNCVFSDGDDVLDKLDWLFGNPEMLSSITEAGYQLIHSRHTLNHRDQIFQWFNLQKTMEANQKIVQLNPFNSPILVEKSSAQRSTHVISNGLHLALLRKGDEKFSAGKFEEAEACYRKCFNYIRWMPEPKLRMAVCSLFKGNAKAALIWIEEPIQFTLAQYKSADPDPVEWAYLIVSLLCLGRLDSAIKHAIQFPSLSHPELDRVKWVCNALKDKGGIQMPDDCVRKRRCSIHKLPERSTKEWLRQLFIMLNECGQSDVADRLKEYLFLESKNTQRSPIDKMGLGRCTFDQDREMKEREFIRKHVFSSEWRLRLFIRNLKSTCKHSISLILHRLEAKYGYFLPYHLSEMRNDELFKLVLNLAREEKIETALIIGASLGDGSTEAFLVGAKQNKHRPLVFCIDGAERRWRRANKSGDHGSLVKWYSLSSYARESIVQELENTIEEIMQDNRLNCYDFVLINSSYFRGQLSANSFLIKQLGKARLILMDGINSPHSNDFQRILLRDSVYGFEAVNPGLRDGYSLLRRYTPEVNAISGHHQ
jgi:tetratricopeptide (TPR) repeat protein